MKTPDETVEALMTRNPQTIPSNAPVMEAFDVMQTGDLRHLPVMDGEEVVGIVSDRDLVESMPPPSLGVSFVDQGQYAMKPVSKVMSHCVHAVHVDEPAAAAAVMMLSLGIGAVPVIDSEGKLVGIITLADIAAAFLRANPVVGDSPGGSP